ncbi:hypothetical protein FNF31_07497 [Cafeteria roenbergensis]|uniref:Uncharacterized protein n=1 Tax=Cafeteria roenbergensis TaxID=33653 RepID=A0A5A8C807_CAFRO|nr:hypothetical protein FNF31_07497 [Cafeteria roenbergensis]KAA0157416.1 hypothetical protein FNF28_06513 [Cafeteria roenbergensis]
MAWPSEDDPLRDEDAGDVDMADQDVFTYATQRAQVPRAARPWEALGDHAPVGLDPVPRAARADEADDDPAPGEGVPAFEAAQLLAAGDPEPPDHADPFDLRGAAVFRGVGPLTPYRAFGDTEVVLATRRHLPNANTAIRVASRYSAPRSSWGEAAAPGGLGAEVQSAIAAAERQKLLASLEPASQCGGASAADPQPPYTVCMRDVRETMRTLERLVGCEAERADVFDLGASAAYAPGLVAAHGNRRPAGDDPAEPARAQPRQLYVTVRERYGAAPGSAAAARRGAAIAAAVFDAAAATPGPDAK